MPSENFDLTPTWEQALKGYLLILENGSPEGKKVAKEELLRMAKAADLYNEVINAQRKTSEN